MWRVLARIDSSTAGGSGQMRASDAQSPQVFGQPCRLFGNGLLPLIEDP
jgi:hypothetical protein